MNPIAEDILMHYGMPRRSGRYPWGSGGDPYQHSGDFLSRVEELKKSGMNETAIANELGLSTTQLRAYKAIAKNERRSLQVETARALKEDGLGPSEAARKMGIPESTYRSLLNENSANNMNEAQRTANLIKKKIEQKGMIDVGEGVEREIGVSKEKLNQALTILEAEGYPIYGGGVPQATNPGKQTILKVICPKGTEHKDIYEYKNIHSYGDYLLEEIDIGETSKRGFVFPESMDSSRLKIRYADESDGQGHTGVERDGVIELRRGVEDLSLGNSKYAQVRIMVDGDRYLKGMAVYSDNIPDGYDIIFNTNKKSTTAMRDVLKKVKTIKDADGNEIIDKDNPFGSLIKEEGGQSYYIDKNGNKKLSLINKRSDSGDWEDWSNALPSQFLSKQSMKMIKKQLGLAEADKVDEFNEICALTNPTVKKAMLETFANDCDSAAVHLKAAALPRQKYHVILPDPDMKDDEVYAPNYENGEKVALIRYPHGGTFEIPVLTVNNKKQSAKKMIGPDSPDAVCINSKVAERLSGADFDGDTVMVIPTKGNGRNDKVDIISTPALKGLKGFDSKSYQYDDIKIDSNGNEVLYRNGKPFRKMKNTQTEMGKISNLITDMTLMGAKEDELARAVRHSMVVIDAEKHKLDYKQSEIDNDIPSLKKRYQGKETGGAATLISRAKGETTVLKRKGQPWINKDTGELEWERINPKTGKKESKYVEETYTVDKINKKTGEITKVTKVRTQASTKMAETKDANTLVSFAKTPQELAYASYANKMKSLANQARKEMINTPRLKYDPAANKTYAKEVSSLMSKLNASLMNAPRERAAQLMAASVIKAKKQDNPDIKKEDLKKAGQKALVNARNAVSAKRTTIDMTDREWEAIQKGAISENKLYQIIKHVDKDDLRQRATPRATTSITVAKKNHIKALSNSGHTNEEIAELLGVSSTTVSKCISGKE